VKIKSERCRGDGLNWRFLICSTQLLQSQGDHKSIYLTHYNTFVLVITCSKVNFSMTKTRSKCPKFYGVLSSAQMLLFVYHFSHPIYTEHVYSFVIVFLVRRLNVSISPGSQQRATAATADDRRGKGGRDRVVQGAWCWVDWRASGHHCSRACLSCVLTGPLAVCLSCAPPVVRSSPPHLVPTMSGAKVELLFLLFAIACFAVQATPVAADAGDVIAGLLGTCQSLAPPLHPAPHAQACTHARGQRAGGRQTGRPIDRTRMIAWTGE
jgi:hypothetical protein